MKHSSTFKSKDGELFKIEIGEGNLSPTELTLTEDPVVISWQVCSLLDTLQGSQLSLHVVDTGEDLSFPEGTPCVLFHGMVRPTPFGGGGGRVFWDQWWTGRMCQTQTTKNFSRAQGSEMVFTFSDINWLATKTVADVPGLKGLGRTSWVKNDTILSAIAGMLGGGMGYKLINFPEMEPHPIEGHPAYGWGDLQVLVQSLYDGDTPRSLDDVLSRMLAPFMARIYQSGGDFHILRYAAAETGAITSAEITEAGTDAELTEAETYTGMTLSVKAEGLSPSAFEVDPKTFSGYYTKAIGGAFVYDNIPGTKAYNGVLVDGTKVVIVGTSARIWNITTGELPGCSLGPVSGSGYSTTLGLFGSPYNSIPDGSGSSFVIPETGFSLSASFAFSGLPSSTRYILIPVSTEGVNLATDAPVVFFQGKLWIKCDISVEDDTRIEAKGTMASLSGVGSLTLDWGHACCVKDGTSGGYTYVGTPGALAVKAVSASSKAGGGYSSSCVGVSENGLSARGETLEKVFAYAFPQTKLLTEAPVFQLRVEDLDPDAGEGSTLVVTREFSQSLIKDYADKVRMNYRFSRHQVHGSFRYDHLFTDMKGEWDCMQFPPGMFLLRERHEEGYHDLDAWYRREEEWHVRSNVSTMVLEQQATSEE